jgi:hypothetical protein
MTRGTRIKRAPAVFVLSGSVGVSGEFRCREGPRGKMPMIETPTPTRPSTKQLLKIVGIIAAVCLFPIVFVLCVFAFAR